MPRLAPCAAVAHLRRSPHHPTAPSHGPQHRSITHSNTHNHTLTTTVGTAPKPPPRRGCDRDMALHTETLQRPQHTHTYPNKHPNRCEMQKGRQRQSGLQSTLRPRTLADSSVTHPYTTHKQSKHTDRQRGRRRVHTVLFLKANVGAKPRKRCSLEVPGVGFANNAQHKAGGCTHSGFSQP